MKNIKKTNFLILLSILVIATLLRLWRLGSIPPHLTPDEAALGYNAYSILKTAKDEYGTLLPIIFRSFGDYKPGLYIYLTVPSVALLGLNEFAARLPSALAGIAAVYLIFLVCRDLFKDKKIGILSAFLLAINPWHIFFSRGAWEANVSLTLTLVAIYLFLKSLRKPKLIIFSSIFFALTFITYQGAKLSTTIVLAVLAAVYWRQCLDILKERKKYLLVGCISGLIIVSPIILSFLRGQTGRLEVFSVFSYPRPQEYLQQFLDQGGEKVSSLSYYLFHSEALNFKRGILGRWFNHFSVRFLIFTGDWQNPQHSAPNQGMLLIPDLILLVAGFSRLFKIWPKKVFYFILLWLILAPLPAAFSRDQVQAVRALNLSIPLVLVMSLGLMSIFDSINGLSIKGLRVACYGLVVVGYLASFIYFLDAYFVHLPVHNAQYWFYGYKEVIEEVTPAQAKYKRIFFKQSYNQPYIYFLFYQKYDPAKYQRQAKLTESLYKDVGLVGSLDNITFSNFSWPIGGVEKGDMVISDEVSAPGELIGEGFKVLSEVKYPDGLKVAFRIIEVE